MRQAFTLIFVLASVTFLAAGASPRPQEASDVVALWPNGAPGGTGSIGKETDTTQPTSDLTSGRPVIRLTNVTNPTITLYRPPKEKATGATVLVLPGGGYRILAWDLEGTEICEWLNSLGVTAALLKYRVPVREGAHSRTAPLQDAQRALGILRHRSGEWHLDPRRIGVIGFSAGGHLAALLSNNFEKRTYEYLDEADRVSCRPDFALLIYPAYLTPDEQRDRLAPELALTPKTPPTFLVQTEDDIIHVENSLSYYKGLKTAKVPAEMHLFAVGNHGYGLRPSDASVSSWPKLAQGWLNATGILHPKH